MNLKYNRGRPFLVVWYTLQPQKGQPTHMKNWSKEGVWVKNECSMITDRPKSHEIEKAHYVVDILEGKFLKNREGSNDDTPVISALLNKYSNDIAKYMQSWSENDKKNILTIVHYLNKNSEKNKDDTVTTTMDEVNVNTD